MINSVKMLLDIEKNDISYDEKINYLIENVRLKVLGYCKISKLPKELEDVVIQIVVNRINNEELNITEISSIKFQSINKPIDELEPYKAMLNRFRKVSYI